MCGKAGVFPLIDNAQSLVVPLDIYIYIYIYMQLVQCSVEKRKKKRIKKFSTHSSECGDAAQSRREFYMSLTFEWENTSMRSSYMHERLFSITISYIECSMKSFLFSIDWWHVALNNDTSDE